MKICKHLRPGHIFLNVLLPDKEAVFRFIVDAFVKGGVVKTGSALYNGMMEREQTMSTGVGDGIGFPHTTNPEAKNTAVLLIRTSKPIDFDALDSLPVDIIMAMVIPENKTTLHIQLLAGVSRLCRNSDFLKAVRNADDSKKLWGKIEQLEEKMAFH